jgi:hypothetical protein
MAFIQTSLLILLSIFVVKIFSQGAAGPEGPPPPPPFLEGQPQPKIAEFHDLLLKSGSKTDSQIEQLVKDWISKQSPAIQANYAKFEAAKSKSEGEAEKAHIAAIGKFSPAAKEADAKLSELAKNPSLSAQDKNKKIQEFMEGLKPEVRNEIEKSMQQGGN